MKKFLNPDLPRKRMTLLKKGNSCQELVETCPNEIPQYSTIALVWAVSSCAE